MTDESESELRARARAFTDAALIADHYSHRAENPVANLRIDALVARLQEIAASCELRAHVAHAEAFPDEPDTEVEEARRRARAAELKAAELKAAELVAGSVGLGCLHSESFEYGCPACMAKVARAYAQSLRLSGVRASSDDVLSAIAKRARKVDLDSFAKLNPVEREHVAAKIVSEAVADARRPRMPIEPGRAEVWEQTLKHVLDQLTELPHDEERAHVLRAALASVANGRDL